jgi:hypothetical protein
VSKYRVVLCVMVAFAAILISLPAAASRIVQFEEVSDLRWETYSDGRQYQGNDQTSFYRDREPLLFDKFDTAHGMLTSVTIDTYFSIKNQIYYSPSTDDSTAHSYYSPSDCRDLNCYYSAYGGSHYARLQFDGLGEVLGGGQTGGGCSISEKFCDSDWSTLLTSQRVVAEDLGRFIGDEQFSIAVYGEMYAVGGGTRNGYEWTPTMEGFSDVGSSFGFKVSYDYEPVPEPSTSLLLALGLVGLSVKYKTTSRG